MQRDIGDVLDRASIAKLKAEKIGNQENLKEWSAFEKELNKLKKKYQNLYIDYFFNLLLSVNAFIWEKESDLRQGKLDGVLYEVGIRAIEIRKLNNIRVSVKNIINKLTKTGWIDIKKEHCSE